MTGYLLASNLNQLVWEFLLSGGVFMVLIVLCSLIAAAIVIHRLLSLRREAVMPKELLKKLQDIQHPMDGAEREELCSEAIASESALGEIACAALSDECDSASEAMDTTEAVAREEVLRLQSGLSILEDVITIAPLLGLLGTVSGLVAVFAELGNPGSVGADPTVLADGIARALNTTIAGLAVAVPTVVARTYFHKKIEAMAVRMEIFFGRLIHARYRHAEDSKPAAAPPPEEQKNAELPVSDQPEPAILAAPSQPAAAPFPSPVPPVVSEPAAPPAPATPVAPITPAGPASVKIPQAQLSVTPQPEPEPARRPLPPNAEPGATDDAGESSSTGPAQ